MVKICVVWKMQCTFTFLTQDYNKDDGMTMQLFNIMERLRENVYPVLIPFFFCLLASFYRPYRSNMMHILYTEKKSMYNWLTCECPCECECEWVWLWGKNGLKFLFLVDNKNDNIFTKITYVYVLSGTIVWVYHTYLHNNIYAFLFWEKIDPLGE